MDRFLRIVEARVNRKLQTRNQTKRAQILMTENKEYYTLPADFAGLRNIEMVRANARITMHFMPPEILNDYITGTQQNEISAARPAYNIDGNSLHVWPALGDEILEILYYQRIMPLSEAEPENWLSKISPDAYIFGLLTEINSFVKDGEAAGLWDSRFQVTLEDMALEDSIDRWSGPTLNMRLA
jgi:hypothetical protein